MAVPINKIIQFIETLSLMHLGIKTQAIPQRNGYQKHLVLMSFNNPKIIASR